MQEIQRGKCCGGWGDGLGAGRDTPGWDIGLTLGKQEQEGRKGAEGGRALCLLCHSLTEKVPRGRTALWRSP